MQELDADRQHQASSGQVDRIAALRFAFGVSLVAGAPQPSSGTPLDAACFLADSRSARVASTPAEFDRPVAIRAKPRRSRRSGPKLGAGTKCEPPAKGKLVGVQSKRHQQRPDGRIRLARVVPTKTDSPELSKRHRRALRHPRERHRRGRGVVPHERHLPVANLGELVALRSRDLRAPSELPIAYGRRDWTSPCRRCSG